ncbi:MAG: carboxypeptidase-like regulatory domain-containing protein, partial [Bacteroidota bacterium]
MRSVRIQLPRPGLPVQLLLALLWSGLVVSKASAQTPLSAAKSMHFSRISLKTALQRMESAWEVSFVYSDSLIQARRQVDYTFRNADFEKALEGLCKKYALQFQLNGRQVVLRPAKAKKPPASPTSIRGSLRDAESGEPLIGGIIQLKGTRFGGLTSSKGRFAMDRFPPGTYAVEARYLGYTPVRKTVTIAAGEQLELELRMNYESIELEEAILISDRITDPTTVSMAVLEQEDLRVVQGLSADPMRTLSTLPGIVGTGGIFGTSQISMRGGLPGEGLFLIDLAPIENPWHVTGNSIINSDMVKKVEVLTGGVPVSYGNALSGVVNIELREGNYKHFRANAAIDAVNNKVLLEGPIIRDRLSVIGSIRASYFNEFFPKDGTPYPIYGDLGLKFAAKVHKDHQVHFMIQGSRANLRKAGDRYHIGLPEDFTLNGTTNNSSLQWRGTIMEYLYHKLTLTGSYWLQAAGAAPVRDDVQWRRAGSFREDLTIFAGDGNKIRAGVEASFGRNSYSGYAPLDPLETEYTDSSIAVLPTDSFFVGRPTAGFYLLYEGRF